jgi:glycosyltransferase involved in cell wall biosynthesis
MTLSAPPARGSAGPQRRLRIVIASLSYHPERPSGSSRLAYDEARFLVAKGHDVWLVAMDGGTGQPEHVDDRGLHVLRYRRPTWSPLDPRPRDVHRRRTAQLLRRYVGSTVDLVHCHCLSTGAEALRVCAEARRACYSLHSPVREEMRAAARGAPALERLRLRVSALVNNRVEGACLRRAHAITCESEFTRRWLGLIHGSDLAARTSVLPGWVDLDRFRILEDRSAAKAELGWPADVPVLFSVRRLVPRMGLDRLLAALGTLKAAGRRFHLVLAGDGPQGPALRSLAFELGLSGSVTFAGRVSDAELPRMYGAADAFLLPTADLECFGLVALEALACGRPVLATGVGAIPEVVGRVAPDWLSEDPGAESIAVLVARFLDGRLPERPPEALRQFVQQHFAADVCLPALVAAALGSRWES